VSSEANGIGERGVGYGVSGGQGQGEAGGDKPSPYYTVAKDVLGGIVSLSK